MSIKRRPCIHGHDITKYNRSDGRCGKCHTIRNNRWRKSIRGRDKEAKYEARRSKNPERIYYRIKWFIKDRINSKTHKIAELERELIR